MISKLASVTFALKNESPLVLIPSSVRNFLYNLWGFCEAVGFILKLF